MKTTLVLAVILVLSPVAVRAQDGHGRHMGDGMNNGGPSFGNPGEKGDNSDTGKHPKNTRPKSPKNNLRFNNNHGISNGTHGNVIHRFNNKNEGSTGNPNGFKNKSLDHRATGSPHGNAWGHTKQVPAQLKKLGVSHLPHPILDHKKILNADSHHSTFTQPKLGPNGKTLHASLLEPRGANVHIVQNHMNHIVNNTSFTAQVNIYNNQETVANHYYWHTWNGTNYCHYYDSWGYHWYGWYWGDQCFWTRWYGGNWWWYDPVYYRWCYWYDGWWWWQDPYHVNVVYIYNNDQYVPANSGNTVEAGEDSAEASYRSKDGTRMVKIVDGDAFLYDTIEGEEDNKPVYLASNVKEVKFSSAREEKPLQVLLVFDDGSFEMFDSDGNPYTGGDDGTNN
ncbi:MAG TPA: hypothetical protein VJ873_09985 [bacterium]|nr:hypothetical protein [bacterium]